MRPVIKTIMLSVWVFAAVVVGASPVQAERLSVKVAIANVRLGPAKAEQVIWQIEKYHPVNVIQKYGEWCLFQDFEGHRGWIYKPLLDNVKAVIVKKENCNVRAGPGTDKAVLFTVDIGIPFKVIERKGVWIHVIHADGDQGWIHQSLVW
ncbi:MAG: hypothetical protein CSA23_05320 [Deltaproteobacteria bacterium]|nr:MAG: hypothetical protein CSA23_05320 [Deltaproteobacteria bacterium]